MYNPVRAMYKDLLVPCLKILYFIQWNPYDAISVPDREHFVLYIVQSIINYRKQSSMLIPLDDIMRKFNI